MTLTGSDYWEVIAEIDYLHFELDQIIKKAKKPLSGLEMMVDQATGHDPDFQKFEDVKTIVARIKELQAMLPPDDPHFEPAGETAQSRLNRLQDEGQARLSNPRGLQQ